MLLAATIALAGCYPVDGDTIRCGKTRYRLLGIDAPEMPGHCRKGRVCAPGDPRTSKASLAAAMTLGPIRFQHVATDRYGRPVGIVWAGRVNLSCWQLSRKQAVHRPDYDRTKQLRCG